MTKPKKEEIENLGLFQVGQFLALKDQRQLSNFLGTSYRGLIFRIYRSVESSRYKSFSIKKKSGGTREILAPEPALKNIQRKLNTVLQMIYSPRQNVHGFVQERNVLSNASVHIHRRWVANIDLKDFFPSFNFGRVRGMFLAAPFSFNESVATALAQICCFKNSLPQGAPTSPVISNIICGRLDRGLRELAVENKCVTSRYADDITFSTNLKEFPSDLISTAPDGSISIGKKLKDLIISNGFEVNEKKVRLATKYQRQQVTGVIVNSKPNVSRNFVRQIRAMLYAWDHFGIEKAEKEYYEKYSPKTKNPSKPPPIFKDVVAGKISYLGMIKGRDDALYEKLYLQLKRVHPEHKLKLPFSKTSNKPVVLTEGITDVKHLRSAQMALKSFSELSIEFNPSNSQSPRKFGDSELLGFCKSISQYPNQRTVICMFDRDVPVILKEVQPTDSRFKFWGGNVYSFAIPIPAHRTEENMVCIELYYKDDELKRTDSSRRRLFLNSEFSKTTGRQIGGVLTCTDQNKINRPGLCIIDNKVFDDSENNFALSKNDFADNIFKQIDGFQNIEFTPFAEIFNIFQEIIVHSNQTNQYNSPHPQ